MRSLALHLTIISIHVGARPLLFLFRRDRNDDRRRHEALDEIFATLRMLYGTAATLKDEWASQWEQRHTAELPPKYYRDRYLYDGAVDAAYDAKFIRGLLYQNRWRSQADPLFETYDQDTWAQVRATIERASTTLLAVREAHYDHIGQDQASWIDRTAEGLDQARYTIRNAERHGTPTHEVVATSTFQLLYSTLMLSEALLDGLRREADERR